MSRRALVVDDSSTIRAVLGVILESYGFVVAEAEDGASALNWLKNNGPADLTCLDWNMPNLDGLQVLRYVRSAAAFKEMPILMCTSEVEMDRVQKALEEGATEYIMKPFDRAAIGEKLIIMGLLD